MKRVVFCGEMADRWGQEFILDANSPSEALRALFVQLDGLLQYFYAAAENYIEFEVVIDDDRTRELEHYVYPFDETLVVVPIPAGSSDWARIGIGIVGVVVGAVTGFAPLIAAGASLILGGIVGLLTPVPATPRKSDELEGKDSFLFSRSAKTSDQGIAVPLLYGRMLVENMAVLSSSIIIDEIIDPIDD